MLGGHKSDKMCIRDSYKIGGKILYKQSDIQAMLEKHYNPIPKKLWQESVSYTHLDGFDAGTQEGTSGAGKTA